MTLTVELYWSFRSPYCYLATRRMVEIERAFNVVIDMKPVFPIAIRQPEYFSTVSPMAFPYLLKDVTRNAEMLGLPFAWPKPDPINMDMTTREISADQPHIHRLTRLGVAAKIRGKGLAFADEASAVIFGGTEDWDQGDHLAEAADRAGLDLAELDREIAAEPEKYDAMIATHQADQKAAGHWGVPLMVFDGEPFFGQDRIDVLLWRLRQAGLKERG